MGYLDMKYFFLVLCFVLSYFTYTCKSPTNNNDDPLPSNDNPPTNDTIPSTMPQEYIPWPSLADSPWPMYRHDPQGTGRSQYPGPQSGQLKWKMSAPGVASGNGFTSTAISSDGTLYIPSSYERHEGFGQIWNFYAINSDGTLKWTWFDSLDVQINREIERTPLVTADGTIILCSMGRPESYVYALNPDGTLKWKYYVDAQPSDPNIGLDGTIYFTTINGLYAISHDGQLKWSLNANNDFKPSPFSGMAISADGQTLYVGGWHEYKLLYAVSNLGAIKWSFANSDTTANTDTTYVFGLGYMPMVDNQNNVYIPTALGLTSISPEGNIRWAYNNVNTSEQIVMGLNGHIYIYYYLGMGSQMITALDYAGQELWSTDHYYVQSGIVMDNNETIYTIGNNEVSAVSSFDGSTIWELYVGHNYHSWYSPALDSGALYFGLAGGEGNKFLYAIE